MAPGNTEAHWYKPIYRPYAGSDDKYAGLGTVYKTPIEEAVKLLEEDGWKVTK